MDNDGEGPNWVPGTGTAEDWDAQRELRFLSTLPATDGGPLILVGIMVPINSVASASLVPLAQALTARVR